jgi:hypothetical protein
MTTRRRPARAGALLWGAGAALACTPGGALKTACNTDDDCASGRVCVAMQCQDRSDGGATGDGGLTDAGPDAAGRMQWSFPETINQDLDLLFMVDDSLGMQPLQDKFLANFPVFVQALSNFPRGLPNIHIAVVSSDMGAGQFAVPQCVIGGDQGAFQSTPRGTCTSSGLPAGVTYLSNVNGVANYTGSLEDAFTCIADLGSLGCGFEQPLASIVRALGADNLDNTGNPQPPAANASFLRKNAYLAIVALTNEDDCSVPANSDLFDPSSRLVTDPLGPLASFRCNEYGHLCRGAPPPRTMAASFAPGECVPAEGAGKLTPVANLVSQIKSLKADPSKILVSVIAGFPDPYNVELVAPQLRDDPNMWPVVGHSCMQNSGEYADPGVRLATFVTAFGSNGLYLSACAPSYAPALMTVANAIGKVMGPRCLDAQLVPTASGDPDCTVTQQAADSIGDIVVSPIPACSANGGNPPCWLVVSDPTQCPGSYLISVERPPGNIPSDTVLNVSCAVCTSPNDLRCLSL